jgi:hypothetical protein
MKSIVFFAVAILIHGATYSQSFDDLKRVDRSSDTLDFNRTIRSNDFAAKKWTLNKYQGLSTSFIGWKGGFATAVSAPVGLQLNRKINNNMFAFAGVSIAPTFVSFRQSFLNTDFNKTVGNNTFLRSNNVGLYPRAEVGLSFMNDDRTFQISGSMSVQRTDNNVFGAYPIPGSWNNGGGLFKSY